MTAHLIFNADDFGASAGVNRGIVDCHVRGVVTSTSMTVTGQSAVEAAAMARDHPSLAIGLHWDVWGEDEREFDLSDHRGVRDEFHRQLDTFEKLLGRLPTHVDSHRHAHLEPGMFDLFDELVRPLGVPLRGDGRVRFVGGFYAQWEWKVTNLEYVSVEFLQGMIGTEVPDGWTEFSCHPAYVTSDYLHSVYLHEREAELATLTDPRVRGCIDESGIVLSSFADYRA